LTHLSSSPVSGVVGRMARRSFSLVCRFSISFSNSGSFASIA